MNPENPGPEPEPQYDEWIEHDSTPITAETLQALNQQADTLRSLAPDLPYIGKETLRDINNIEVVSSYEAVHLSHQDSTIDVWREESTKRQENRVISVGVFPDLQAEPDLMVCFDILPTDIKRRFADTSDIADMLHGKKFVDPATMRANTSAAEELTKRTGLDFVSEPTAQRVKAIIDEYIEALSQKG